MIVDTFKNCEDLDNIGMVESIRGSNFSVENELVSLWEYFHSNSSRLPSAEDHSSESASAQFPDGLWEEGGIPLEWLPGGAVQAEAAVPGGAGARRWRTKLST